MPHYIPDSSKLLLAQPIRSIGDYNIHPEIWKVLSSYRPLLHLLYVVGLVSSCICFTIVADCNFLSWTVTVRCVSGALMGAVIGTFLFYGIGIPIGALLAWCVLTRPARTGSSVRRLHDISVCYSPCIQCWRQLTCSMPAHTSQPLQGRRTAGSVDVVVGSYHGSGRMNPGDMMALPPPQGISYTSSTGSVAPCTSARTTSSMQEGVASTQAHEADTQYPFAGLQARDAAI
ncbi:hypothetical protein CEUSTIGMA_g1310.t1 [Chlamydomonas eustigma]|uniref:Uncharacterized protein n=1 Tax=Chlamydomonas eustigma TaxID=1157962 RepID=A0A250WTJ9_9CHLO|nr:hypothetical protein CEUSTIGMA_g1310.t1 [Chlamydomonas eustigma]|eukprot:GAX73860.1 hypothetical protein CEUSTIGMA_g1310.t1 [Chlamydomonas eustigma]